MKNIEYKEKEKQVERLWKMIPGIMLVALFFFVTMLGNVTSALADMGPLSPDVFIRGRQFAVTTVSGLQECSNLCESDSECIAVNWFRRTSTCTKLIAYFSAEVNEGYISALKPQGY
ncbi:PAN domain-containing protein [Dapis sp. BLCC M229]|uniref:PAN domain-containing protein n=1 Tax=Dapis sp. BLCC M229 TaxID=3400188 RepID=UPI003CF85394